MSKVALVTGASRGIGRAAAVALARRGVAVAVNHRDSAEDAKGALAEIQAQGADGIVVQADVADPADVDRCFTEIEDALGPVTILVNNAGRRADGLALTMSDEAWNVVLATNLYGPFACTRRAMRQMLRSRWGRVVNVASVAGLRGSPGQANYAASKAGLIGLTRTLAREVGGKGITVNAIAPGPIATELIADLSDDARARLVSEVPVGDAGSPEEVGELIAFLCTEEARYINGAVLVVDGGMTA